jgi:hypothetical protein
MATNIKTLKEDNGDIIKKMGLRMSVPVVDTIESGIYGQNAYFNTLLN